MGGTGWQLEQTWTSNPGKRQYWSRARHQPVPHDQAWGPPLGGPGVNTSHIAPTQEEKRHLCSLGSKGQRERWPLPPPLRMEADAQVLLGHDSPLNGVLPVCFFKLLCRSLSRVIFLADFAQQYNSCSRAVKSSRKWNLKCRNKIIVVHEL